MNKTELAQQTWSFWTEEALELVEQLPDVSIPENEERVRGVMRKILLDHQRQYGAISPAKEDVDFQRLATVIFMVLRTKLLQPFIPNGISIQITNSEVYFRREHPANTSILRPSDIILFIKNYGLTGEESTRTELAQEYNLNRHTVTSGVVGARTAMLNHPAVRPIWAIRPQL